MLARFSVMCFVDPFHLDILVDCKTIMKIPKVIRKSKKERQHNGQKKRDQWAINDLQNISQKLKIEQH
jgi:hypothetical protein